MGVYDRTLPVESIVRIARQNSQVNLDHLEGIIRMRDFMDCFEIGDEIHLVERDYAAALGVNCGCGAKFHSDYYDPTDNTHRVWDNEIEDYSWILEGALEIVPVVTQEDEDEAIASILRASQARHLPLLEGKYGANAEDCPACIPNLDKMPYPFTCPGPREDA